jgi:hypothetical protein
MKIATAKISDTSKRAHGASLAVMFIGTRALYNVQRPPNSPLHLSRRR